ncbi:deoxyguanosinetriphosphate triphosphohydrolase [Croceitalea sp. MTPC9]|uniref:dGTP triphosphohydrolase n=1 Tax=unclassified Croceitalea TaxID=2632280 RepID=UPI002B3F3DDA|nr:deoxyguanosinetriphosphate triphosphohydrolase [Croceitalea sp. MTPC6]GMN15694.1 deoxyguanosinetriphosphate triphosphohydrolase [Croceitalea sp. MTPC9]
MKWNKYLNPERIRVTTRDKTLDPRNEFESDFGRVIFSPATRRMHDKTQVFPLTLDDNIHSRLTHSMEVMAIGHSLGLRVCEQEEFLNKTRLDKEEIHRTIPVILKNACLVHDIGNPPFGHFGETVIANYFEDLFKNENGNFTLSKEEREDYEFFDGNAQGLRVLTKLQLLHKEEAGLNLTYATLGAFLKYPNSGKIDKSIISTSKRGVFQSEIKYLKLVGENCGMVNGNSFIRHPLSYLMEAADSICYLVMDIEDGFNKGWYNFDFIKSKFGHIDLVKKKLEDLSKIESDAKGLSRMVKLRIFLISELVKLAVKNYVENLEEICDGSYNKELIKDDESGLTDALSSFTVKHIFKKREIQQLELTGHSVLTGLLDYYIDCLFKKSKDYKRRALGMISGSIIQAALFENNTDEFDNLSDYAKLRIIVDFISGMTDQFALIHFQKLSGQKIS